MAERRAMPFFRQEPINSLPVDHQIGRPAITGLNKQTSWQQRVMRPTRPLSINRKLLCEKKPGIWVRRPTPFSSNIGEPAFDLFGAP
jgi:hypothetical protein